MQIINIREAIRYPLKVLKSELKPLIGICWIYILLNGVLQLSINYVYVYLRQNALLEEYLNAYWRFAFVFCPVAHALLAAICIVAVYRHLLFGPQPALIDIVLRRDLLSDKPTLSVPIYFFAGWAVLLFALFIAGWEYSISKLEYAFPFEAFPDRHSIIPRMIFENVCIIAYSFVLSQLVLVFPYVAASKTFSFREIKGHIQRLDGNRWRVWAVLSYFSLTYFTIHAVLTGGIAKDIIFDFYRTEFFVDLRCGTEVVVWFVYVISMAIFSASVFEGLSKKKEER